MWRTRYKNKFKTSNPRLIITAVQSFPNMTDTVEKAIIEYNVKALQKDPVLLEITSLFWMDHGCNFIPLYFQDDCPKLAKLPKLEAKSMFWCVGYQHEAYYRISEHASRITHPGHKKYRELLEYTLDKDVNSSVWQYLFKSAVDQYVNEQTKDWTPEQKSRRFKFICNTDLKFLRVSVDYQPDRGSAMKFLDDMYTRDIYEFIFNEYS